MFTVKFTNNGIHLDGLTARAAKLDVKVKTCRSLALPKDRLGTGRASSDPTAALTEAAAIARVRAMKLCTICRANAKAVITAEGDAGNTPGLVVYTRDETRIVQDTGGIPLAWCRNYRTPKPEGVQYVRTTGDRPVTTVPDTDGVEGIDRALLGYALQVTQGIAAVDFVAKDLGADLVPLADLLRNPRSLMELVGRDKPRASYATVSTLLIPGALVESLRGLPEHSDGHVSNWLGELTVWIGGNGHRLEARPR